MLSFDGKNFGPPDAGGGAMSRSTHAYQYVPDASGETGVLIVHSGAARRTEAPFAAQTWRVAVWQALTVPIAAVILPSNGRLTYPIL
jgi:hypothetical protein